MNEPSPPVAKRIIETWPPDIRRLYESLPPAIQPTIKQIIEHWPPERDAEVKQMLESTIEEMTKKQTHWTKETVARKMAAAFPGSDPANILNTLGGAPGGHRVQLAIIKLCDEGKGLPDLAHYVKAANVDVRDVLSWAEYPKEAGLRHPASESDREEARRGDLEQYLRWIEQDQKETG